MSTTGQVTPTEPPAREERRQHPRRRVERLAYIRFDKDNGGVLLDVGEGGLKFQGIASSMVGELCVVKFTLPGASHAIEVRGQIAWSNSSRKGGGVRFLELPEDARLQIKEWMSQETPRLIATRAAAIKPVTSKHPLFQALTMARKEAGKPPLMASQLTMPTLNAVPVAPEVRVEQPSSISSLSVETIAASKAPDKIAEIVPDVPAAPRAHQALPESSRRMEPALIVAPSPVPAPIAVRDSESFPIAGLDKVQRENDEPKRNSRVARVLIVAATACAVVLAAVVGISRSPALLAFIERTPQAAASPLVPVAAHGQDLKADAVDGENQRRVLQSGSDDASLVNPPNSVDGADADTDADADPQPVEADPSVVPHTESGPPMSSAVAQHLDLQPPMLRQAPASQAGLDAPSVDDVAPSDNLLDPRVLATEAPALPAPAQPPTAAKSSFRQAVLIHSVQATHPGNVTAGSLGGVVHVSATIDKDGVPVSLRVVSGDPRLSAAALAAIGEWRYDPALLDGEPVESTILITMNFQPLK